MKKFMSLAKIYVFSLIFFFILTFNSIASRPQDYVQGQLIVKLKNIPNLEDIYPNQALNYVLNM